MAVSGGDLVEINGIDPNLGQLRIFMKAGEDATIDMGGRKTSDSDTNIDTSATFINTMQVKPWKITCTGVYDPIKTTRQELEKGQAFTNTVNEQDWVITWINGVRYAGTGKIVGDFAASFKDNTISITMMGGGILVQI